MAQRRMFSLKVIDTDNFLAMPISSRLLYYDLSMRADDDGFVESPKKILNMIGCAEDDLKLLCAKQYVIPFETGVCVIKHWNIHNLIRHDRYNETACKSELSTLRKIDGKYEKDSGIPNVIPNVIPNGNQMATQVRLGKVSIDKNKYIVDSHSSSTLLTDKSLLKDKSLSETPDTTIQPRRSFADDFEAIWAGYPNKDGKKAAFRSFMGSIKTPDDLELIKKALSNYLNSEKVKNGYIKNGSTWFNNWRDWITMPVQREVSCKHLL